MNAVNVYGIVLSEEEIKQQQKDIGLGIIRYHDTTYLEYEIPKELEIEFSDIIEKK